MINLTFLLSDDIQVQLSRNNAISQTCIKSICFTEVIEIEHLRK